MDYDSGEEDALSMQLRLSPKLPSFDTLRNIHALPGFNKEDNQELPTEAEDDKEDEDEVEELPNPKRCRPKVVYGGGGPLRSSGRSTKKTLKAASQIGNQNTHKSTSKRPSKRPLKGHQMHQNQPPGKVGPWSLLYLMLRPPTTVYCGLRKCCENQN